MEGGRDHSVSLLVGPLREDGRGVVEAVGPRLFDPGPLQVDVGGNGLRCEVRRWRRRRVGLGQGFLRRCPGREGVSVLEDAASGLGNDPECG